MVISPDGNHGILGYNKQTFTTDGTSVTNLVGIPNAVDFDSRGRITYHDSGTIIYSSPVYAKSILGLNGGTSAYYIANAQAMADGYILQPNIISKINTATGAIEKTYDMEDAPIFDNSNNTERYNIGNIGNYFYDLYYISYTGYSTKCWYINEEDVLVKDTYTCENREIYAEKSLYPQGVTLDSKYLVCLTNQGADDSVYGQLAIIEKLADKQLKLLSPQDLPIDLQPYTTGNWMCAFNPYSGYLTFAARRGKDYAIFKYENGQFVKQVIDQIQLLDDPNEVFNFAITIANDGSRIAYGTRISNYELNYYIVNLTTYNNQKVAFKYALSGMMEDVITGFASQDCEDGESFVASVGGVSSL